MLNNESIIKFNKGYRLFHGTAFDVERFSTDKIGTGEGTQVFGWGLYFTEDKDIAESYANKLSSELLIYIDGKEIGSKDKVKKIISILLKQHFNKNDLNNKDVLISNIKLIRKNFLGIDDVVKDIDESIDLISKANSVEVVPPNSAFIYEVETSKNIKLINYDTVINDEVLNLINNLLNTNFKITETFGEIYKQIIKRRLITNKDFSLFLLQNGYDGIVFNAGSHYSGLRKQERNVIIFDDKIIRIINKDYIFNDKPRTMTREKKYPTLYYALGKGMESWDSQPQHELHNLTWTEAIAKIKEIANEKMMAVRLSETKGFNNQGHYFAPQAAKGTEVKKDLATVYNDVVKYIMKDQKVSREKAISIINEEGKESWIEDMVNEGETNAAFLGEEILTTDEGKYLAKGDKIPNSYQGRTSGDIWSSWTKDQKTHFLIDHFGWMDQSEITKTLRKKYSDLPSEIQKTMTTHIKTTQYGKGAIINQYKGKTPQEVWDSWTPEQRQHFLSDHDNSLALLRQVRWNARTPWYNSDYDKLKDIKYTEADKYWSGASVFKEIESVLLHHTQEGQYAKGTKIKSLLKQYDFNDDWEYFDYVINSYINGNFSQAKNLYEALDSSGRAYLFTYLNDEASGEAGDEVAKYLNNNVRKFMAGGKMKSKTIEVFTFEQLSKDAKENAIEKYRDMLYNGGGYDFAEWAIDDDYLFEPKNAELEKLFGKDFYEKLNKNSKYKDTPLIGNTRKNIYFDTDRNSHLDASNAIVVNDDKYFLRWLGIPENMLDKVYYKIESDGHRNADTIIEFSENDSDYEFTKEENDILEAAADKFKDHMSDVLDDIKKSIEYRYSDEAIIDDITSNEGDGDYDEEGNKSIFAKGTKVKTKKVHQTKRGKYNDSKFKAMKAGKHISKDGNIYYEYRSNRTDIDGRKKLGQGDKIRTKTDYNKLVGKKGDEYYFVDYIFHDTMHGKPFNGATGTVIMPVSKAQYDYATSYDGIAERFLDATDWTNPDTGEAFEDESDLTDYLFHLYSTGQIDPFEQAYKQEDAMRELPEFSDSDAWPIFEVIGGGRSFSENNNFDKVYDKELLKKVEEVEASNNDSTSSSTAAKGTKVDSIKYVVKYWNTEKDFNAGNAANLGEYSSAEKAMNEANILLKKKYAVEVYEKVSGETYFHSEENSYAKGTKVSKKYSNKFEEVNDYGDMQYYIRDFGTVETDKKGKIDLVAVAEILDLEHRVSKNELPKEGNFQLDITLVPYSKFISKKMKASANDDSVSIGSDDEINIVNYMGGLNYSPQDKVHFKTQAEAEKYLYSKELNDKISAEAMLSGFILDRAYNRLGQTNWEYLAYMTGESEKFFAKGTKVQSKQGLKEDKSRKALHAGKRTSANGNVYYEFRKNHSDKNRTKKLSKGNVIDSNKRLDDMLNGYLAAVLFTSSDDNDKPLDLSFSIDDFAPEVVEKVKENLKRYISENAIAIKKSGLSDDQIGIDIWFTQSHQGAGFFDRNLDKATEEKLTSAALKFNADRNGVVGDDGKIYIE